MDPRTEIVPLTSLAILAVVAVAVSVEAEEAAPASDDVEGALLQPANANAAIDISDKTFLRMGKPHQT
ncbi:hypothetical protein [Rhodanobacter sp. B04]|uniref:hypothetical protein n=1 Tax=Rhodanobacter sp. B04 TaxID=1945860 RepID=UPI0020C41C69|nr:hypothetical protein [Rhodanobacter sp. B04]